MYTAASDLDAAELEWVLRGQAKGEAEGQNLNTQTHYCGAISLWIYSE